MLCPFSLPNPYSDPVRRGLLSLARPALEKALALDRLNKMYAELPGPADARHFSEQALDALGVGWEAPQDDVERIPRHGPLVIVANHPFGGLDGLILTALLRRVRTDLKLLGNHILRAVPDLRDTLIYVDPFGGPESASRNVAALRNALAWVRGGGALAMFPAGEVSHAGSWRFTVTDPAWSEAAGHFILRAGAPVTTLLFEGRNSTLFHLAGVLHPRLRTAMLPRELLKHRGTTVKVRAGGPIPFERLESLGGGREVADHLRVRTYVLRAASSARRAAAGGASPAAGGHEPIAAAGPVSALAREVAALPASQHLFESGPYLVAYARADQVPALLAEIGRLREISFRLVGEGTGRARDLDRFDAHYLHLFVWNRRTSEVAGAYRMGPTDEILPRLGKEGLYTSTLFCYKDALLDQMGPALEMGRSFVRPEYQRTCPALTLLWKGIGRFVMGHPRYRRLFGPVSISNEYQSMSRHLLITFLKLHRYVGDLGRLLRPRRPPRLAPVRDWEPGQAGTVVRNLEEVDDLIRDIESDRKSMPILLRQYLKLNGVLLGFNLDPDFGDVLDGLILVDLVKVDRAILTRYMGREGVASFLAAHAGGPGESA